MPFSNVGWSLTPRATLSAVMSTVLLSGAEYCITNLDESLIYLTDLQVYYMHTALLGRRDGLSATYQWCSMHFLVRISIWNSKIKLISEAYRRECEMGWSHHTCRSENQLQECANTVDCVVITCFSTLTDQGLYDNLQWRKRHCAVSMVFQLFGFQTWMYVCNSTSHLI